PRADDLDPRQPLGRPPEGAGVGELAPEVQAAHEAEQLAQRSAAVADALGQRESRPLVEEQTGPLAAQAGRGQQEDGVGRYRSDLPTLAFNPLSRRRAPRLAQQQKQTRRESRHHEGTMSSSALRSSTLLLTLAMAACSG